MSCWINTLLWLMGIEFIPFEINVFALAIKYQSRAGAKNFNKHLREKSAANESLPKAQQGADYQTISNLSIT
jgi:hypothetical protein